MQADTEHIINLLEQQKAAIESAIAALNSSGKPKRRGGPKGSKRSKAVRQRMSMAQRKRWKTLRLVKKKSKS